MQKIARDAFILLNAAAIFLIAACQSAAPTQIINSRPNGVILKDGAWAPNAEMVTTLETRLPAYLAQQQTKFSARQAPIVERLAQYKFQYWGEMKNGKRVIAINAFCAEFDYWKTQRVFVLDGGDCFFQLEYEIKSGIFSNLSVNGEA
ncbi:MAG: hypothetical protein B6D41_09145 [Chloroflexi bacterium UTCFX4]|jgi:hypothetical protein|nr:MAG: hypothetical protein B6D41_09145 [Chloroflexi bacterium UTCFX4]